MLRSTSLAGPLAICQSQLGVDFSATRAGFAAGRKGSNAQNIAEELLERQESHQCFLEKLNQLDQKYQEVLKLRYFEELSYQEITVRLDLDMSVVKTRIFRAKELLRESYG
jgi:RNA polymerase sigma factor (sigma-70 family)